jgi:hypothetical protein
MDKESKNDDINNSGYYTYNSKKNNTFLPLLYASGDGIYITLIIYIIYWVIKNYNLISGLMDIHWLLWVVLFIAIVTVSFIFRYFINKFD